MGGQRWRRFLVATVIALAASGRENAARADESGTSFWQLGSYASQAAIPQPVGFSVETTYYSASVSADTTVNSTRGGRTQTGVSTRSNYTSRSTRAMRSRHRYSAASSSLA